MLFLPLTVLGKTILCAEYLFNEIEENSTMNLDMDLTGLVEWQMLFDVIILQSILSLYMLSMYEELYTHTSI